MLVRRPGQGTAGGLEAWTLLSALAEATKRVELGMLVAAAPFRNPVVFAKMIATLDEVSDGRVIAGLGGGWHQPEFDAFGIPFDHLATRFEEAVHIIKPLLRDGRVDFTGRFYQAPDCELIPRGPRPAGPPLLLAGNRPRMLDIVAQHAEMWNTAWHAEPTGARERLELMRQACERNGRDPATLELIQELTQEIQDSAGINYIVRTLGSERIDGTREGWLEFVAIGAAIVLRTGTETTQSKREDLAYWALGLNTAYLKARSNVRNGTSRSSCP